MYDYMSLINHVEKPFPRIAFLLAAPAEPVKHAFQNTSPKSYHHGVVPMKSIVMVVVFQYLIDPFHNDYRIFLSQQTNLSVHLLAFL